MEFGKTLREAREAKNYTVSQLAEKTRILPQIVEGLETGDFKRIPAPIYGRGFVKLCCEALGLEVKPMQDAFMDAYAAWKDGTATPVAPAPVRESPAPTRAETPSEAAAPKDAAETAAEPPAAKDLFGAPIKSAPIKSVRTSIPSYAAEPPDLDTSSRYAAPTSSYRSLRIPAIPWRLIAVAVAAIAIIAIAVLSLKFVWGELSAEAAAENAPRSVGPAAPLPAPAAAPAAAAPAAKAPRTPQPVKPLYID